MTKRYMDFMPAPEKRPLSKVGITKPAPRVATPRPATKSAPRKTGQIEPDVNAVMRPREIKPRASISTDAPKSSRQPEAKTPETPKSSKTMKIPASPFVNTAKVEKRPLSKTVYQKSTPLPADTPSEPVTIIDRPDRDSKAGFIVAIIITIFLGAAAGTIAFLLLPK